MPLDDELDKALSQALGRYHPQLDYPAPIEYEPVPTRRPKKQRESLRYVPVLQVPKLMKLLKPEAKNLLLTFQESGTELGSALLSMPRDGLPEQLKAEPSWEWPAGSTLALRKPVGLPWLLNVANWVSNFSTHFQDSTIDSRHLLIAASLTRGLGPGSFLDLEYIFWADQLDARQVTLFEDLLRRDPDEPFLRACLCHFYREQNEQWEDILWHIDNCPESPILHGICTRPDHFLAETIYCRLLTAWARQIRREPQNALILSHAAKQISDRDQTLAFQLYQRCSLLEPSASEWPMALAEMIDQHAGPDQKHKALEFMRMAYEREQDESVARDIRLDWLKGCYRGGLYQQAEEMAWELLRTSSPTPPHGLELHDCNLVLGHLALDRKDVEDAKIHLLAAGRTPGYCTLDSFGPHMCLASRLLAVGEKDTVLRFFELCSEFWKRPELEQWSTEVRRGLTPEFGANLRYSRLLP